MTYEERMTALIDAHAAEIEARGAEALNFGAGADDDGIYSKTTLGGLETTLETDGSFTHVWRA